MLPGLWQALLFLLLLRTWLKGNYPGISSIAGAEVVCTRALTAAWKDVFLCHDKQNNTHLFCVLFCCPSYIFFFLFNCLLLGIFMYLNGKEKQACQFSSPWGTVRSYLKNVHFIYRNMSPHWKIQGILLSFSIYSSRKRKQCARRGNHSVHTLLFTWGLII